MSTFKLLKPVLAFSIVLAMPWEAMAIFDPLSWDTNGDGQVSTAERQAGLSAEFTKIDSNNDGYLSLDEVQAWRNSNQIAKFNALDTDGSSSLSLAELQANTTSSTSTTANTTTHAHLPEVMTEELFNLLDSDKNGVLSWEEFAVLEPGKGETIRHFVRMDTDNDSKISQAEFLAVPSPGGHGGKGRH